MAGNGANAMRNGTLAGVAAAGAVFWSCGFSSAARAQVLNVVEVNAPAVNCVFRVTCIIPVYNGERYLGQAIESVLRQSHADLELIIVDDCSTDRSWDIVQEYAPGHSDTVIEP